MLGASGSEQQPLLHTADRVDVHIVHVAQMRNIHIHNRLRFKRTSSNAREEHFEPHTGNTSYLALFEREGGCPMQASPSDGGL